MNGDTPIAGWFIREHPIKIDDLGVPPFMETFMWLKWPDELTVRCNFGCSFQKASGQSPWFLPQL